MTEQARGKFDPVEGEPYGRCLDCGEACVTKDAASEHMSQTRPESGGSSHRISVTNPDRAQRIQNEIDDEVETAVEDAIDVLRRLVESGDATPEEISEALTWHSEFAEAWDTEMNQ